MVATFKKKERVSFYARLGLHLNSSPEEVKDAWKRLSRLMHPDACTIGKPETVQQAQSALFAELSEAYTALKDKKLRSIYDKTLEATGDVCGKCGGHGFTAKMKGFAAKSIVPCAECQGTGRILRSTISPEMLGLAARRSK